ncbi:MAG: VOC family protein [Acidobacteriaceae bacterium]
MNANRGVNRSVPTDTVLPHFVYRDLPAAVAWLTQVFGFTEHYHYGEPMSGAQVYLARAFVMLKQATDRASHGTQALTIIMDDVDAHYARAKAAGAKILEEPHETVYGEFQYVAEDPEGHHWLFSRHARDLSPTDWGATVVHDPRQ